MTLYLITAGDGYYPCSGTDDWEFVTADAVLARHKYDELPVTKYQWKCLIRIEPTGWRTLEET